MGRFRAYRDTQNKKKHTGKRYPNGAEVMVGDIFIETIYKNREHLRRTNWIYWNIRITPAIAGRGRKNMGVYYQIVCHRCMKRYKPSLLKMREMQLNERVAAEVGRFFLEHQHEVTGDGGLVEMVSDSPASNWDLLSAYDEQKDLDRGE